MIQRRNLTGQRFGRLVAVADVGSRNGGRLWLCRCDCGNDTAVTQGNLVAGGTVSCGCYRVRLGQNRKHGESKRSRLYTIWAGMKQRCAPATGKRGWKDWEHYGGRGITVCEAWQDYEPFRDWALANGYADDLTLDRIDVDGNYEPGNCRWATLSEQRKNRRDVPTC